MITPCQRADFSRLLTYMRDYVMAVDKRLMNDRSAFAFPGPFGCQDSTFMQARKSCANVFVKMLLLLLRSRFLL